MQILFVTQALKNAQQEVVRVAGAERIINNQHMICDDEVDYKPKTTMNVNLLTKVLDVSILYKLSQQAGRLYNVNKPFVRFCP